MKNTWEPNVSLTCILFHRLGPYHWARLNAVGKRSAVLALELSSETSDYAWDRVDKKGRFERITLFSESDSRRVATSKLITRVFAALEQHKPAVVAIPGWSDKGALAALWWCKKKRVPCVLMSESTAFDEQRSGWKESVKSRLVRMCSAALVGGKPHIDYLVKLGMPRNCIFTGYDVVDNDHFSKRVQIIQGDSKNIRAKLGLPERFFLASKRFIEKKNIFRLLDAYANYCKAAGKLSWKLVILGDGPLRPEILKQREELGLVSDVLLPGFKQYQELPSYYALASAFVHASTVEQWGLVVNEAMASGLPVLVSERCGCAADLVVIGRNGFTFNPFDVRSLTELMLRLTEDETGLAAMGHASREIISQWSARTFANNLQRAVQTALSSPQPRFNFFDYTLCRALLSR